MNVGSVGAVLPVAGPAAVPGAWVRDALCAQVDPELFFPETGVTAEPAKAVCAKCPVTAQCLAYALDNHEEFGIWGGASRNDRRALLKEAS